MADSCCLKDDRGHGRLVAACGVELGIASCIALALGTVVLVQFHCAVVYVQALAMGTLDRLGERHPCHRFVVVHSDKAFGSYSVAAGRLVNCLQE